MPHLLDVNVLIALLDANHVHHARATRWFLDEAQGDWLSCPITQNGAIRIMSGSRYGPTSFTPSAVVDQLQFLMTETSHRFVADDVSLLDDGRIDRTSLTQSSQVTDIYLLALAVQNNALLATMDHRLRSDGIVSGHAGLRLIPNQAE
jgi:toxin-antitoxin system PIN domain toxin